MKRGFNAERGFTLIELLIAVVILGILVAIAVPVYTNQVTNTNRTEGNRLLMDTAQSLERCYTRYSAYDDDDCGVSFPVRSENEWYEITDDNADVDTSSFSLEATPLDAQADRDAACGSLTLDHRGTRGNTGDNDPEDCW